MKITRFAAMLTLAVLVVLSPVRAQDHGQHMMMDHGTSTAKKTAQTKKAPCRENGQCPVFQGMNRDMGAMPTANKPWEKETARTMAAMHENMAKPYTGDADADFIRGMIPHHEGAVEMARTVLKYGDDEQAKEMARRIIVAQKGEIAWMQKWLRQRQIPETGPYNFNR